MGPVSKRIVVLVLLSALAVLLDFAPVEVFRALPSMTSTVGLNKLLSLIGLLYGMISATMLLFSDALGLRETKTDKRFISQVAFASLLAGFGLQLLVVMNS